MDETSHRMWNAALSQSKKKLTISKNTKSFVYISRTWLPHKYPETPQVFILYLLLVLLLTQISRTSIGFRAWTDNYIHTKLWGYNYSSLSSFNWGTGKADSRIQTSTQLLNSGVIVAHDSDASHKINKMFEQLWVLPHARMDSLFNEEINS